MIINIEDILPSHKVTSLRWYKDNGQDNPCNAVAIISSISPIPCIVIAYWLGELLGYPDDLKAKVEMLTKYYEYKQILGKPIDCPW